MYGDYLFSDNETYFNLSSKKIFTETIENPIKLFDKYEVYGKISNNLLLSPMISLICEDDCFDIYANKFKIYKKYIFYKKSGVIYYADSEDNFKEESFYDTEKKVTIYNIDFDIFNDYIYIYDGNSEILVYSILDKKLKFESDKILHDFCDLIKKTLCLDYYMRIFVTKNYVFLYSKIYILIFFKDLKFFRKINLPKNKLSSNSDGFFVQDNIIFLLNNECFKVYQLY